MARHKFRKIYSRSAKSYKMGYSKSKKSFGLIGTVVGAALYGAVRQKLSDAVAPLTAKVPLGNIADEVVLGGSAIFLKKMIGKKAPILNPLLNGALVIESARIGEAIATGSVGLGGMSSTSNSNLLG